MFLNLNLFVKGTRVGTSRSDKMFLKLKLFNLMKYGMRRKEETNIGKYENNLVNSIILSFSS